MSNSFLFFENLHFIGMIPAGYPSALFSNSMNFSMERCSFVHPNKLSDCDESWHSCGPCRRKLMLFSIWKFIMLRSWVGDDTSYIVLFNFDRNFISKGVDTHLLCWCRLQPENESLRVEKFCDDYINSSHESRTNTLLLFWNIIVFEICELISGEALVSVDYC